ncbi:hypothetical protein [Actinoalloteichus hymeniacidonis]|uniref:Antibiotic biosynthesis monooxygenase n=1 Tax=Actinoalloteichus hymeniacidonis TaxID=340345 RepID=A0AAC9MZU0_9PSEU|nr:hypothetical protein [Actinoalloteichus hymeniacidonis]AOS64829.1 hypothetical protein TL08_20190 [Actinoalloteichus hymeniacidonis]MBB5907096.1 hypothetical protein [Actinoalloteichus hymeniacidonis]
MSGRRDHPPNIDRPDAGTALMGRWYVDSPEHQAGAADALLAERSGWGWLRGLISISCFASTDGKSVLTYSQWVDEASLKHFIAVERPSMLRFVDERVPGRVERHGTIPYQVYASTILRETRPAFDRVGITVYETAGHDAQRAFCDMVISVLEEGRPPGLIAAHLHVSLDGNRVLEYLEWVDQGAQDEFTMTSASREKLRMLARSPGVWLIEVGQFRFLSGVETVS